MELNQHKSLHQSLLTVEVYLHCKAVRSEGRWMVLTDSCPELLTPLSLALCASSCRQTRLHCLL